MSITYPIYSIGSATLDTNNATIQALFNENYFRSKLSANEVQAMDAALAANQVPNAYYYWASFGITAGWAPCKFYDEATYLAGSPDVKALVQGQSINPGSVSFASGLQHWLLYGRAEIVAGHRTSAATLGSFAFTSNVDTLVADSAIGGLFTGTDTTFAAGDSANGGAASLSSLNLSLATGSAGAATISNIGTVSVTGSGGSRTVDATNFSGVTSLSSVNTIDGALQVTNLNLNPSLGISNSALGLSVTYKDAILAGNAGTVNLALSGVTAGTVTLSYTAAGYFATAAVASNGAAANALASLTGTALQGTSTLNITGAQALTLPLHSSITSVRTVTATPVTALTFADTATGITSNLLTATFNSAGSTLTFSGTQTLAAGNTLRFTGAGNTLYVTKNTALAATTAIGGLFSNLQTLGISTGLTAGTVTASNFGSLIRAVNLDAVLAADATVGGLATGSAVNIGLASGAAIGTGGHTLTLQTTTSAPANTLTANLLGNADAAVTDTIVFNGVGTATVHMTTGTATHTTTLAASGSILTNLNVTGGASGGTIALGTLTGSLGHVDASASASSITATAAAIPTTLIGSLTAANTLTGGALNDVIVGGAAADAINAAGGTNTVTGHAVAGASDINTYKFSHITGVTTFTDFNPGTSSTSVDIIDLEATLTATSSATTFQTGVGSIATAGAVSAVQSVTLAAAPISMANAGNTVLSIAGSYASAAALQAAVRLAHFVTSDGTTNWAAGLATTAALPALYINSSDGFVHLATITTGTTGATTTTTEVVTDIAVFSGITALTNFDTTDFLFY